MLANGHAHNHESSLRPSENTYSAISPSSASCLMAVLLVLMLQLRVHRFKTALANSTHRAPLQLVFPSLRPRLKNKVAASAFKDSVGRIVLGTVERPRRGSEVADRDLLSSSFCGWTVLCPHVLEKDLFAGVPRRVLHCRVLRDILAFRPGALDMSLRIL